jgi:hypothetical protein
MSPTRINFTGCDFASSPCAEPIFAMAKEKIAITEKHLFKKSFDMTRYGVKRNVGLEL